MPVKKSDLVCPRGTRRAGGGTTTREHARRALGALIAALGLVAKEAPPALGTAILEF